MTFDSRPKGPTGAVTSKYQTPSISVTTLLSPGTTSKI